MLDAKFQKPDVFLFESGLFLLLFSLRQFPHRILFLAYQDISLVTFPNPV